MKKLFPKLAALTIALTMALCCVFTACAPEETPNQGGNQETPEKTLSSITLDDSKVKKSYKAGEKFDPTGLVVTAVYSDKSTKAVTDYTYSPNGELKESDKQITVTYQKKTATISITVVKDTTPDPDPDPEPQPQPQPGETIPEIEGVTARWIGSWQNEDSFFTPGSWMTTAADADEMASSGSGPDTLAAPTLETDGSLKVTGHSRATKNYMAIYQGDNSTILNPLHNKDEHDVLMDQPIVYSMLLKTEGHFGIMLFSGSKIGWTSTGPNDYRAIFVEYNDGTFTFKAEQNIGAVVATVQAPLSAEKFTRVDFVFTRKTVDGAKKCEMKFYVDGKAQALGESEVLSFDVKGYGQHIQFSALDNKALWIAAPKKDA